tara:strand:+ start:512 stop:1552 length:1041 start_codon:yes stop_codon:yes gene_type:complete
VEASLSDPISYADAGVDIQAGNQLVQSIGEAVSRTHRPGVLEGIGGFGGLFHLRGSGDYKDPVLVSGTDGVGTKLALAIEHDRHDHVGQDLVAMCINDIVVTGARPLFFLDYFATGRLDVAVAERVVRGIARACELCECSLIGGETAEMPDFYKVGDYDLAGFAVGVVERDRLRQRQAVRPGHQLIGLPSSGIHSNGFSLVRRLLAEVEERPEQLAGASFIEALLAPTQLYAPLLANLADLDLFDSAAHITGGGLIENLPRALPEGCGARLDRSTWSEPAVFDWIRGLRRVANEELDRTFNMGLGMILAVPKDRVDEAVLAAKSAEARVIGEVVEGDGVSFWERRP